MGLNSCEWLVLTTKNKVLANVISFLARSYVKT